MTITTEDIDNKFRHDNLEIPKSNGKYIIKDTHNLPLLSLYGLRLEENYKRLVQSQIKGDARVYSHDRAIELFLYPLVLSDPKFIKNLVDGLFNNVSLQKDDKLERMLTAYALFTLACQSEALTNLTNSDYWAVINGGDLFDNYFKWIYVFNLARYSHDKDIYPTRFRTNMIEYFDIDNNPSYEEHLIETNRQYRELIPLFITEILSHKNDEDFKVVINYFKNTIQQHNINNGDEPDDYNYFMENQGIHTWSFEELFTD
ncbi:hypothetical protein [Methylovorus glucosotrophus]|uniref:Uncharacterized protein n=1 Tax=Methylovorus glucosotrophus (strain SIP3-4) TaxID=582744 RepID=C6X7Z9_METGS|nr:hypothetical protein [Methylovorus glucosotrophus]ACT51326.1 hypothetical protein Msip34_2084 [Methylovorus glucosotrophus SIP3-4]